MSQTTAEAEDRIAPPSAFPGARTVVRVRGVPVRIDLSWLIIAVLVVLQFFGRFAVLLGDLGTPVVIAAATVATLLFFASLLAHEVGHAFTSLDRGIPVLGITLFLMGGVTESTREAQSARDEFVIVGIGPFISLVLAGAFGLAYAVVAGIPTLAAIFGYLAWANLLLAIFNVLPGYPLDGGRLLRSVLWWMSGRPHASTRWAARVGQLFALALLLLGIGGLVIAELAAFGGLWQALIGFFLLRGATDAHRRAQTREQLGDRSARQVMGSAPPPLPPDLPLDQAVLRLQERPSLLWPVGDPLQGAVSLGRVDQVPQHDWAVTPVSAIAYPVAVVSVEADTPMDTVVERLVHAPGEMLLVVEGGRAIGLLTPSLVAQVAP